MRHLFPLICLLALPLTAHAGGDYTPAQISQFSGSGGHYQFIVTQQGDRLLYNDYCRSYRVLIEPRKHCKTPPHTSAPFTLATWAADCSPTNGKNACITARAWSCTTGIFLCIKMRARGCILIWMGDRQPENPILPCCFGFAETCFIRFQAASSNS